MTTTVIDNTLAEVLRGEIGENAYKCYQCKRCTAGCPVAGFGDLHPAQIMRAVQLGDLEAALTARFIWVCTGCETCSTRCPQDIDIAAIMDGLRIIARREGLVREDAPFADILRFNYDSIARWGRLYELELIGRYKVMRPDTMLDDAALGVRMFLKGKLSVLPELGNRREMREMVRAAERIEGERGRRGTGREMEGVPREERRGARGLEHES